MTSTHGGTDGGLDWGAWHDAYADPASPLSRRLAAVQEQVGRHLDATAPGAVRVVSSCAGDGRDLLGVLAGRDDAARVDATLVEYDAGLADRAHAAAAGLPARVDVRTADAGSSDTFAGLAGADLLLFCGIFGNVSDADARRTVTAARELCAPGAEVVWTRHRRAPDLTPDLRDWFVADGFEEVAFVSPGPDEWSVGVHRLLADPLPLVPAQRWFTFQPR